jgi:hypothetical protein
MQDFATQDQKREIAREYIQDNPEESNRSISEEVPVGRDTVGTIKEELEEEESDSKVSDTDTQTDEVVDHPLPDESRSRAN